MAGSAKNTEEPTAEAQSPAEPELSYEEAREELDSVVRRLESGGLSLKESLALWERGEQLAKTCEQWLEGARAKLAVAMAEDTDNGDGTADTPF
ncbi:MAG: exodeoxyribonuclease VII small subunit [Nocardiopsaceae bacterium]|nr:exodeoxyribonuclease VII small subunit [Nocardiopsaceae bacterium]